MVTSSNLQSDLRRSTLCASKTKREKKKSCQNEGFIVIIPGRECHGVSVPSVLFFCVVVVHIQRTDWPWLLTVVSASSALQGVVAELLLQVAFLLLLKG
ncbi:hypothetical protein INR49_005618 [Caranx melampygus]|nr:hypothetical protein INR49_005618 [Caranx melampygus]